MRHAVVGGAKVVEALRADEVDTLAGLNVRFGGFEVVRLKRPVVGDGEGLVPAKCPCRREPEVEHRVHIFGRDGEGF